MFILFGVLHCLASCILIYSLAEWMVRLLNRRNRNWILPAICAALGIAALVLDEIYNIPLREVITNYTVVETDSAIAGLFVFTEDWWTADYFPLLPFIGYFLLGAAAGHILYKNKKSLLPRWTVNGTPFLPSRAGILSSSILARKSWVWLFLRLYPGWYSGSFRFERMQVMSQSLRSGQNNTSWALPRVGRNGHQSCGAPFF
jgi:uncharacterized membrane protein